MVDSLAAVVGAYRPYDDSFGEPGQLTMFDDPSPSGMVAGQRRLIVRITHEYLLQIWTSE
ncbi:hypothetical protein BF95_01230 [Sphingobium sp. Ant17]|nr:hypothetical protein BF95_01230 [Sphingobium sp. Ant17]